MCQNQKNKHKFEARPADLVVMPGTTKLLSLFGSSSRIVAQFPRIFPTISFFYLAYTNYAPPFLLLIGPPPLPHATILLISPLQSIQIMIITLRTLLTHTIKTTHFQPLLLHRFSTTFNAKINYYKVLEIDSTATVDEIKSAFVAKAKQFHPDVNPLYEDKFKLINEAYKTLSDQHIRRQYQKLRQSIQNTEEQIDSPSEPTPQSERDPFSNLIKTNLEYLKLMKKQGLNMHIARDYTKKTSEQKLNEKQKEINRRKRNSNLSIIFLGVSAILSAALLIQIGWKQYKNSSKIEK